MNPFYFWAQFGLFACENILIPFPMCGGSSHGRASLARVNHFSIESCQIPVFLSAGISEMIRLFVLRMQMD